uniref:Uncharacterized protein n=1 Tax=Strigamia maritima TaxID=126957 RepID=T1JMS6_STRMM
MPGITGTNKTKEPDFHEDSAEIESGDKPKKKMPPFVFGASFRQRNILQAFSFVNNGSHNFGL